MNFELVFIRHGQSTNNATKLIPEEAKDMLAEITEKGKMQAGEAKKILQDESFDTILASDMMRTRQTAEIIFGDRYEIVFDKILREVYVSKEKGALVNRDVPIQKRIQMRIKGFNGGETFESQKNRMKKFIEMVASGTYGGKVAMVSHGGCLKALRCIFKNLSDEEALYTESIGNCGIERLLINKERNQIQISFNS